jgi:hypothetical protein
LRFLRRAMNRISSNPATIQSPVCIIVLSIYILLSYRSQTCLV